MSSHLLQTAEENVRRGIGTCGGCADPADQGAEEGIEEAGAGEGKAECSVHATVAGDKADGHQSGYGDEGEADGDHGFEEDLQDGTKAHPHEQAGQDGGEEDSGSGRGEPVEGEDGGFCGWSTDGGRHAKDHLMQAVDGELDGGDGVNCASGAG